MTIELDDFTASLIEFTATRECSDNWNRTAIEWIASAIRSTLPTPAARAGEDDVKR